MIIGLAQRSGCSVTSRYMYMVMPPKNFAKKNRPIKLEREEFFSRFLDKGTVDDLLDPAVRSLVDKGYLAVKEGGKVYVTEGERVVRGKG